MSHADEIHEGLSILLRYDCTVNTEQDEILVSIKRKLSKMDEERMVNLKWEPVRSSDRKIWRYLT